MDSGGLLCGMQTVLTLHMCFPNGRANPAELLFRQQCKWVGGEPIPVLCSHGIRARLGTAFCGYGCTAAPTPGRIVNGHQGCPHERES